MVATPRIDAGAVVLEGARVVGDVTLGPGCSVWYNAVVRGEQGVVIGRDTNVQDNAVIHVSEGHPVRIGDGVSIGHGAIIHGCTVGSNTLVGMGAIVLDGAVIGSDCIIGAGSVVTQGTVIPDGSVAFGSPARVRRPMTEEDVAANRRNARAYVELARRYAQEPHQADGCA